MGLSHKGTCFVIYGINLAVIALTILLPPMNINLLFGVVLLSAVLLFPTVHLKRRLLARFGITFSSKDNIKKATGMVQKPEEEESKRIAI